MTINKFIDRFKRMDLLIAMEATGTPEEFANKLGIKRSTLFDTLQEMKEMGVVIRYSSYKRSYYYVDEKRIVVSFGVMVPEKKNQDLLLT